MMLERDSAYKMFGPFLHLGILLLVRRFTLERHEFPQAARVVRRCFGLLIEFVQ